MTAVTPEPIIKVAMGFMAAKHLFVASEVGLFEALAAGPASIEELARRTGVPSRTIAIVATAMGQSRADRTRRRPLSKRRAGRGLPRRQTWS